MTYYQYFRLKGPPFQPASPDSAVYFSPTHLQALSTLESGLAGELSGLTLLTGETGTGKTTLIYSLLQRDYKRARIAHIDDPKLSFMEMMRSILGQLNLYSIGSTKLDYLEALDRFLKLRGKEERIAIVVDESQVLSDDVLEELRLLSNHGQRHDRGLQLILVGQPELAERLKKPELRHLNQRISSRGILKPLNHSQAIKYVECRLSAQGGKISAIFEPRALKHLLRPSDGIPRKINMLCHTAMSAAYSASEKKVSVKTAKKVAAEYHDSVGRNRGTDGFLRLISGPAIGAALALLLVLGFVYPSVWSDWVLKHTVSFGGAAEQADRPVEQAKTVKHLKTAESAKTEARADVEGHPDSGAKPKAAAPLAAGPVKLKKASLAPAAAASPVSKSGVAGPVTTATRITPGAPTPPAASSAAAASATADQRHTPAPATSKKRGQVIVRYGDTLEKIAIRYLGSKAAINKLVDANPQLTDINQLRVGQIIYLPPGVVPKASQDNQTNQTAKRTSVSQAEVPAGQ